MTTSHTAVTTETVRAGRIYKGETKSAKRYVATLLREFGGPNETTWCGRHHHPTTLVSVELRAVEGGVQAHLTWETSPLAE